ncbi:hypothetical protein COT97_02250 [Candidatus Falkowbacteria bacterium CG10_big_fil_rev_8_21_14_0_10_39_11]|uniref:DUF3307 domain-containing protein n=1 Tax=Candidatus Falkowbacteria bacterium CG10_big_fil_rev_8_21_14_0_10_39_11 TaxID=1974565 RepID=A0A2H0V5A0_9BACT|nr:MAG: hypothetical protein COT97_02250 [Candidatus Falkowbacteria bacterium CG10_big_fil_rev_8_21_14_0_10_39_11]
MTVHGAAGAFIGERINSIPLTFIISFITHFLFDIIPHGDHDNVIAFKTEKKIKQVVGLIAVDAVLGLMFLSLYFSQVKNTGANIYPIIAGIFGGVLPDLLVGLYQMNKKYFFRFNFIHMRIHELIKFRIPLKVAFVLQILFIIIIWQFYKFQ